MEDTLPGPMKETTQPLQRLTGCLYLWIATWQIRTASFRHWAPMFLIMRPFTLAPTLLAIQRGDFAFNFIGLSWMVSRMR